MCEAWCYYGWALILGGTFGDIWNYPNKLNKILNLFTISVNSTFFFNMADWDNITCTKNCLKGLLARKENAICVVWMINVSKKLMYLKLGPSWWPLPGFRPFCRDSLPCITGRGLWELVVLLVRLSVCLTEETWVKLSQLRKWFQQIDLRAYLGNIFLINDYCGEHSPLWALPPLGTWT